MGVSRICCDTADCAMFSGAVSSKLHDLSGAFVADLPAGRLTLKLGDEARVAALPIDVLAGLFQGDAGARAADALGAAVGADARALLETGDDPTPESVGFVLSVALGLRGLGTVRLERWGDALLAVIEGAPSSMASVLARVVGKAAGVVVDLASEGALLSVEGEVVTVLVTQGETAAAVRAMVEGGATKATVLTRLHGG